MRRVVVSVAALALVACKETDPSATAPEVHNEDAPAESNAQPIAEPARPSRPAPTVMVEPVTPSPFLVVPTPTQQPRDEAFQAAPPPLNAPKPAPFPRPWSTSGNNQGKPCPVGRCLLDGKCVIPGGPIAHPDAPPGAVFGACGGDGGQCSRCRCVSPKTLISTPNGEIPIEDLRTNDTLWSIHHGRMQAVRILATQRVRVQNHSMARIELQNGFVVEISGEHPTGDGRNLWALEPGEMFGDTQIQALTVVPYDGSFTYDVLPDSDTGSYFVHGMWLGSTMFGQTVRGEMTSDTQ
jgi:hypothetical protein